MTVAQYTVFEGYEAKREALRAWLWKHYLREFDLQPETLLDVGCGNGFWSGLFADRGIAVTAFDADAEFIADGKRKYPEVRFLVRDADKALRGLGTFDVVFARTLPQFFGDTLDRAAALVRNLLKHVAPGGTLLLSIYTDGSGQDRPMLVGGTAHHWPDDALCAAVVAGGGTIVKTARVGKYLQIGVTP